MGTWENGSFHFSSYGRDAVSTVNQFLFEAQISLKSFIIVLIKYLSVCNVMFHRLWYNFCFCKVKGKPPLNFRLISCKLQIFGIWIQYIYQLSNDENRSIILFNIPKKPLYMLGETGKFYSHLTYVRQLCGQNENAVEKPWLIFIYPTFTEC